VVVHEPGCGWCGVARMHAQGRPAPKVAPPCAPPPARSRPKHLIMTITRAQLEVQVKDPSPVPSPKPTLPPPPPARSGPKHLTMTMTRAQLEVQVKDLLERTRKPCEACLKDAGVCACVWL